jgi:hypothetical protein
MKASLTSTALSFTQETLRDELSRFFKVAQAEAAAGRNECMMPACPVDEYWHELLELPEEYEKFCLESVGVYVEHVNDYEKYPHFRGSGVLVWVPTYERLFGKLPAIWFADSAGTIDWDNYAPYSKEFGSELVQDAKASWVCSPKASWVCSPKASWVCSPKASWESNPLACQAIV